MNNIQEITWTNWYRLIYNILIWLSHLYLLDMKKNLIKSTFRFSSKQIGIPEIADKIYTMIWGEERMISNEQVEDEHVSDT